MRKKTYEEIAMSGFAIECERCDGEGEWMQNEFIDTCPDCDGKGFIITTEKNMEIDVITLLQLDAGAKLYTACYAAGPRRETYTFKSFDTYKPGDFAFVLPSGQVEPEFAKVVHRGAGRVCRRHHLPLALRPCCVARHERRRQS